MKEWSCDKRYTGLVHAQANNEEEYLYLIKDLFREHAITEVFSCDIFESDVHLFDDDLQEWHMFFDTPCMKDEKYENEDLPDPQTYDGIINEKPDASEYPIVLTFRYGGEKSLIWYSYEY